MIPENIEDLIHKYLKGTATSQEKELLNYWYELRKADAQQWPENSKGEARTKEEMLASINAAILPLKVRRGVRPLYRYAAAAAILLLAGSVTFFNYISKRADYQTKVVPSSLPGGTNGAVLTLASGERVQLNSTSLNKISLSKTAGISSYSDSILMYKDFKKETSKEIAYNTLTTPYGRQFSLVLSDGTKVYMNAGSTLKYPVAFHGTERLVKLTGEAYFEVVHNSKMPFRVKAGEQLIEDIGTSFNVNAYSDEKFSAVTLVEGSVKIRKSIHEVIINPGEQTLSIEGKSDISVRAADFDSALAWKNGLFHFKDEKLDVVLKQISRWYNLEIEYKGAVPSKSINGEIYRNMDGREVLLILKSLGINYKLEGNKLIISK